MASSHQRRENVVELFLSTETRNLNYNGSCTIDIKMLSKMFVVEPDDKDTNSIEISLYAPFYQHQNILGHVSSFDSTSLALVFPSIDACKAVYDVILKYQVDVKQEIGECSPSHQLKNQILLPLLNEAESNPSISESTKNCILNALQDIIVVEQERNMKSELDENMHETLMANSNESSNDPVFVEPVNIDVACSSDLPGIRVKTELIEDMPAEPVNIDVACSSEVSGICVKAEPIEDVLAEPVNSDLACSSDLPEICVKTEPIKDMPAESSGFLNTVSIDTKISVITEALAPIESTPSESRKRRKSPEACTSAVEFKHCKVEPPEEPQQYEPPLQPVNNQGTLMATKKIIKSTHFLIHRITNNGRRKHELIMFISDQKNLCYTYFYERKPTGNRFSCINCNKLKHSAIAHLRCNNDNGEFYLELGLIKHICAPVNYDEKLCLYIEPCTLYSSLFFEVPIKKKNQASKEKSKSFAQINRRNGQGALMLDENPAVSAPAASTSAPSESISSAVVPQKILRPPEFELQIIKNYYNVRKYQLIIFVSPDNHKFCYVFYQEYPHMRFTCKKCQYVRPNITAFVRDGDDGEKYVCFNKHPHTCEPEVYSAYSRKALEKDEYQLLCNREGIIRPIVYLPNDNNLCYVFYHKKHTLYVCEGCENRNILATLNLKLDENYEYSLTLKTHHHSCEPKAVSTVMASNVEQEKALLAGKFKFFNDNSDTVENLMLLTFPFNDENVKCYIYKYTKALEVFCCIKCLESEHVVVADVLTNSRREEYVLEGNLAKHICEPFLYSNLTFDNILIKYSSGLAAKKFNEKIWVEKNRLQTSNFELQRNNQGTLNGILCVFTSSERENCYRYSFDSTSLQYSCQQCKIFAKVYCDENGKYFVWLSPTKHRCQQLIYLPEKTVIRKPDFIVADVKPIIRLIVFTSPSHEYCYVYSSNVFRCFKCTVNSINVHAKLFTNENGEECVLLARIKHQCQPQKFENVARKYGIKL